MNKPKSGNPNPNPSTRFKEGNTGKPPGAARNRSIIAASVVEKVGLEADERPLAFFLRMMKGEAFQFRVMLPGKDRANPRERVALRWYYPTPDDMKWGATNAAPYCHPKLANIQHTGNINVSHEDFLERLDQEDDGQ